VQLLRARHGKWRRCSARHQALAEARLDPRG
jgi:hypothetical protein